MSTNQQKTHWWIILAFIVVPLITSLVSTIHVVSFFELSNYYTLSLILALAFELGALSALAGLIVLDKINKSVVWLIFILLTVFQMVGNTYFAYDTTTTKMVTESNLIKNFSELFGFVNENPEDVIFIKRMIALLTGGVLPVISLSFLHLLMSYVGKAEIKTEVEKKTTDPGNIHIGKNFDNIRSGNDSTYVGEPVSTMPEETTEPEVTAKTEDRFIDHLAKKRMSILEDRKNYFPLLSILFRNGVSKEGDELPSYSELMSLVEPGKYAPEVIKTFLVLCNFLDITKMNGQVKKALMSYKQAHDVLDGYLSL